MPTSHQPIVKLIKNKLTRIMTMTVQAHSHPHFSEWLHTELNIIDDTKMK